MTAFPTWAEPVASPLLCSGQQRFEALSGRPHSLHAVPTSRVERSAVENSDRQWKTQGPARPEMRSVSPW